jgi:small GTP-binding protein
MIATTNMLDHYLCRYQTTASWLEKCFVPPTHPEMETVPRDVLCLIFNKVDVHDRANCRLVCRLWRLNCVIEPVDPASLDARVRGLRCYTKEVYATMNKRPCCCNGERKHIFVYGAGGVGKTATTIRWTMKSYILEYDPTIEDRYNVHIGGTEYFVGDTAGSCIGSEMLPIYMATVHTLVLVYSIISKSSFDEVKSLAPRLLKLLPPKKPRPPILLIGNKCDLSGNRVVLFEEAAALARLWNCALVEISAKSAFNCDKALQEAVALCHLNCAADENQRKKQCSCQ